MTTALAALHLPTAVTHAILGSFGGALQAGGAGPAAVSPVHCWHTPHAVAFMSGVQVSLAVGAFVAIAGAALVLACLPSPPSPDPGADD